MPSDAFFPKAKFYQIFKLTDRGKFIIKLADQEKITLSVRGLMMATHVGTLSIRNGQSALRSSNEFIICALDGDRTFEEATGFLLGIQGITRGVNVEIKGRDGRIHGVDVCYMTDARRAP